jgi:hypothetical protein
MKIPEEVLIHQLVSLRAQIDAMLTLINDSGGSDIKCNHPSNSRLNLTTMGGPTHWICNQCNYEYKEEE